MLFCFDDRCLRDRNGAKHKHMTSHVDDVTLAPSATTKRGEIFGAKFGTKYVIFAIFAQPK